MPPQQERPGVQRWTGRQVRALRNALRLSKTAFANDLGVSHRTITNWERDLVAISPFSEGLLDQRLRQADPDQRARFDAALPTAELIDSRHESPAIEHEYNSLSGPVHPLLRVDRLSAGSDPLATRESDYHQLVKDLIEWARRMRRRDMLY